MMGYDRVQLKRAAKQAIKGQRPHPMLVTFLFLLIANIGSQLINRILGAASGFNSLASLYGQAMLQYDDPAAAIQYVLLSVNPVRLAAALLVGGVLASVIASLWLGLMHVGYSDFCLGMVRGRQPQIGALFNVFPQWAGVLLTQFLVGLFECLWGLLFCVGEIVLVIVSMLLFGEAEAVFILIVFASYIALFLGILWVTLRYAMVDFLIVDQGLTGMDAIRESKRLMQGNIGRLFTLQLSFFGWYLLEAAIVVVVMSFGLGAFLSSSGGTMEALAGLLLGFFGLGIVASIAIGIFNLWLTPYVTGAQALFYEWARGGEIPTPGSFGGQGGWGQPQSPQQQHYNYNRNPGPSSGTGIGPGPQDGGSAPGGSSPKPPKPKDDPWD